jgi:two-component system sensor histidine kinase/response regulator
MNTEPRVNILMVDDEPSNLLALEATLECLGQCLVKANSGKEALRQVLEKDFAVILLDVHMPDLNGIEAAAIIRERERSRHIPIIFLTGQVKSDEMMFKGYSAGAVDYLMKPITPEILIAKVEVFVELALSRLKLQEEIRERIRNAAEISQLNLQLEQQNKALEERTTSLQETITELDSYSYSISHDMRAPLRTMKGYSDILVEECLPLLSPEHQGYLHKISSGATRLDHLIQDVLSYSWLSRSRFQLQEIDLDLLTRDIIEQYPGMQAPQADLKIDGTLPHVWANEATLTQCISNLLGNAIKFVAPGEKAHVRIRSERVGSAVRIWFEDRGIGISPRDQERIFGIFVKVHPPTTYQGTGIGLSIVRRAAEKMGGAVGLESEPGIGSRFWLQLRSVENSGPA